MEMRRQLGAAELLTALKAVESQCRQNIRRAAFSPPLGAPMTEKMRGAIADECRKLEDFIEGVIRRYEPQKLNP